MITTETTAKVTCDKCGRAIVAGETVYQLATSLATAVIDGRAVDLRVTEQSIMQLCETDYTAAAPMLEAIAPAAAVDVLTG